MKKFWSPNVQHSDKKRDLESYTGLGSDYISIISSVILLDKSLHFAVEQLGL